MLRCTITFAARCHGARYPVCTENLDADVVVMKSAKDGVRADASGPLNGSRDRCIFSQRPVGSDVIVIASIGLQDPAQMRLA